MRGRSSWWSRRRSLGALLLLVAALLAKVQLRSELAAEFPHITPHALAHFLADFSNYPKLYPDIESWSVEGEAGNYTWWRYSVTYSCGTRCSGRVELWHATAEGGGAPSHGVAPTHRLMVTDERCSPLPFLPFLRICSQQTVESVVGEGAGGGAVMSEAAQGTCGAAQMLGGRCRLANERERHMHALRVLIAETT